MGLHHLCPKEKNEALDFEHKKQVVTQVKIRISQDASMTYTLREYACKEQKACDIYGT